MWMVAPTGMTISLMSLGTPVLSAASRLAGIAAMLLPVAAAVRAAGMIFLQKRRMPSTPAAI